jgi:magnesium-transporting ATPase (P-type)
MSTLPSTNPQTGLSTEIAQQRLLEYGTNTLTPPVTKTLFELVLEQFDDRLVQVLVAVVVLSSVLASFENDSQAFIEPAVIVAILTLNAVVGRYIILLYTYVLYTYRNNNYILYY